MSKKFSIRKVENEVEHRLAIGLIVSTRVLRELRLIYNEQWIEIPFVRTLAKWCFQYFERYGKAPRHHIQAIFESHARKGMDEDQATLIEDFLAQISEQFEKKTKFNVGYLLDEVTERFRAKNLEVLAEDIQAELSQGRIEEAESLLPKYKRVDHIRTQGVELWKDEEAIMRAFDESTEPLFTFPGEFGRLINEHLVRTGLIGLMGRIKIGKSFTLQEFAYRASRARCNVAYIEAGDHSEAEAIRRFYVRVSGRNYLPKYCREMVCPVLDCQKNQDDSCRMKHRQGTCGLEGAESLEDAPRGYHPCSYCYKMKPSRFRGTSWYKILPAVEPLSRQEAVRCGRTLLSRTRGRRFKLACFPNTTLSVSALEALLDSWQHFDEFVPDVIVLDYADILAPEPGMEKKEGREQQTTTWKALRRMAQKRHCLVITATQADAESYDTHSLKLRNFSEARTKYDHVTGMLALNQTEDEKHLGQIRVGWLVLRHGEFDQKEQVTILQCLQRGQPFLGCFRAFRKKRKEEE